jgi:dTMP kinase
MFIAVEGIEGSGKSTLVGGLAERIRSGGHDLLVTREPGGTPLGDAIREIFLNPALSVDPLAELFLVNAARAAHVASVIRPALEAGRIVLCDRFVDSTIAYQGFGRGLERARVDRLCAIASGGIEPDLTLLVDVPTELSRARIAQRAHDRVEAEGEQFHERVRRGFLELARGPRHRVLDGSIPPAELVDAAYAQLCHLLRLESNA